jgi:hypothetical protein
MIALVKQGKAALTYVGHFHSIHREEIYSDVPLKEDEDVRIFVRYADGYSCADLIAPMPNATCAWDEAITETDTLWRMEGVLGDMHHAVHAASTGGSMTEEGAAQAAAAAKATTSSSTVIHSGAAASLKNDVRKDNIKKAARAIETAALGDPDEAQSMLEFYNGILERRMKRVSAQHTARMQTLGVIQVGTAVHGAAQAATAAGGAPSLEAAPIHKDTSRRRKRMLSAGEVHSNKAPRAAKSGR